MRGGREEREGGEEGVRREIEVGGGSIWIVILYHGEPNTYERLRKHKRDIKRF